jgi:hypothetical protein
MERTHLSKKYRFHSIAFICIVLPLLTSSCSITQSSKTSSAELVDLQEQAKISLQKAERLINDDLQHIRWEPGEVWLLQKYLELRDTSTINNDVDNLINSLSDHPFEVIVNSNSKPIILPSNPGRGFEKFTNYCIAPFGEPSERAASFIESFLSTKESGFVLTHQILVIVWAQDKNLSLSKDIIRNKKNLLKQIRKEQDLDEDEEFTDLYAERAMILLRYGKPTITEAIRWINKIIESQQENGGWYAYKNIITYDGETIFVGGIQKSDIPHATALCMLTLAEFLSTF